MTRHGCFLGACGFTLRTDSHPGAVQRHLGLAYLPRRVRGAFCVVKFLRGVKKVYQCFFRGRSSYKSTVVIVYSLVNRSFFFWGLRTCYVLSSLGCISRDIRFWGNVFWGPQNYRPPLFPTWSMSTRDVPPNKFIKR